MLDVKCYASGSSGNCYVVSNGQTSIMIDPGLPLRKLQRVTDYMTPDAALCTHEHMDHAAAVSSMMQLGTDCYMTRGTADALGVTAHHRCHILRHGESVSIGGIVVSAFDTEHDAAEPCGFLLDDGEDRLLYATDTYFIKFRFKNLTKILVEANYSYEIVEENKRTGRVHKALADRLMQSHFAIENVVKFLEANDLSKVKEIWLLHLSKQNSNPQKFQEIVMRKTGLPTYIAGG